MDKAIQVFCIIDKLPPFWKDYKHTLKHKKEELTLVELGSHLHIEESLRMQDSDKPKGKNVAGPLVVNMVEHNNSYKYNDHRGKRKHHDRKVDPNKKSKVTCWKCGKPRHLKKNCKGGRVGNKDNGSSTNGLGDGYSNSLKGIDYFDTYALVARNGTIKLLIAMVSIHNLIIHQMDVKTTFLNGDLDEEVYMNQPLGFIMPGNENKVCKLIKSLYGLNKFDETGKRVIICLYVEDMLIFNTDQVHVDLAKEFLSSRFSMKDMREADVILVSTPMDTSEKLMPNNGQAVSQLECSKCWKVILMQAGSATLKIIYLQVAGYSCLVVVLLELPRNKLATLEWSEMLPEVLDIITQKYITCYEDYMSFAGVCKYWHLAAARTYHNSNGPPSRLPSLMLAKKSDDHESRELFLLSNKSISKIQLPEINGKAWWYSSCGWLLNSGKDFASQLINPLSREIINLPKIDTFLEAILPIRWEYPISKANVECGPSHRGQVIAFSVFSFDFARNNICGTHVLLEACKVSGHIRRFIYVSTDEVYGETEEDMMLLLVIMKLYNFS
uniref:Zinc finger, CCHC-type n=1 Tax=Tanacetum cinerariifolium TaxID=118510 RepID=A0A6L2LD51_TANCI|nr:zinc finger, CCHC-type [Tanacetum cinerariifolium]